MNIRLVDDWRKAHTWMSVHLAGLGFVFSAVGAGLSWSGSAVAWRGVVGTPWMLAIAALIFVCVAAGRVLKVTRGKA